MIKDEKILLSPNYTVQEKTVETTMHIMKYNTIDDEIVYIGGPGHLTF